MHSNGSQQARRGFGALVSSFQGRWLDLKIGVQHTVKWLRTGSQLFGTNVRISSSLLRRRAEGFELTRRETFPGMLPSTFREKSVSEDAKRMKSRQELANLLESMVETRTRELMTIKPADEVKRLKLQAFSEFREKLIDREASQLPLLGLNEVLPFAKLFKEEFRLENLSLQSLQTICRLLGITPYVFHKSVILQLRHHMLKVQREDRQIFWDGVDSLDHEELVEMSQKRALRFHGVDDAHMRMHLQAWVDLSLHPDIPIVLLLWSRCMSVMQQPPVIAEKLSTKALPQKIVKEENANTANTQSNTSKNKTND